MAKSPVKRTYYTDDFVTTVLREAKKGVNVVDLETKHGVKYATIIKWCECVNIKPKKGKSRKHDWEAIKKEL